MRNMQITQPAFSVYLSIYVSSFAQQARRMFTSVLITVKIIQWSRKEVIDKLQFIGKCVCPANSTKDSDRCR